MNSGELESILAASDGYLGVFSRNFLPIIEKNGDFLVLNSQCWPCTGDSMGHWVALFKASHDTLELFDSFGLPPVVYNITSNYLNCDFLYNTRQYQGISSTVCGHYAALFCLARRTGVSYKRFLDLFQEGRYEENDRKVVDILNRVIAADAMRV